MRPLIHYSDLDAPVPPAPSPVHPACAPTARRPPVKKRKRHHQTHKPSSAGQVGPRQHWDDPGSTGGGVIYDEQEPVAPTAQESTAHMLFGGEGADVADVADEWRDGWEEEEEEEGEEGEEKEEESRPLTHEEIWDDAALIDAWNAAEAEYEAFHGTSKSWKTEEVKKSPLWYNKPYTPASAQPGHIKPEPPSVSWTHDSAEPEPESEPDTAPIDFDTYIPTHDPTLGVPSTANFKTDAIADTSRGTIGMTPFFSPPSSLASVSCDEAFQNALSATYWSGYWTAVYQLQKQSSGKSDHLTLEENEVEVHENGDDGREDLVPTQR